MVREACQEFLPLTEIGLYRSLLHPLHSVESDSELELFEIGVVVCGD